MGVVRWVWELEYELSVRGRDGGGRGGEAGISFEK